MSHFSKTGPEREMAVMHVGLVGMEVCGGPEKCERR